MTDIAAPATWRQDIRTVGAIRLQPDARVVEALVGNHLFETAVADLIDNSLDATAANVMIRFVTRGRRIQSFYVIDDGRGIRGIDRAMTAGASRSYTAHDLGLFGVGLKSASFSQADSLTVITKTTNGPPAGRRWLAAKARSLGECDIVDPEFCRTEVARAVSALNADTGTIVRWDQIRTFPDGRDHDAADRFLEDAISRLRRHLGITFHRFIERGDLNLTIETESAETSSTGVRLSVAPVDPFGYLKSGEAGYPKELKARAEEVEVKLICHIWPPRSTLTEYTLGRHDVHGHQGFFFYRRDRLLQSGGWNNVEVLSKDLQLARVEIDLPDAIVDGRFAKLNAEKSRVEVNPEFAGGLIGASAEDGISFEQFLESARTTLKAAVQRKRSRARVMPIGKGVAHPVRRTIEAEVGVLDGHDPVDVRWKRFDGESFFHVDRAENVLWLNDRYRSAVTGLQRGTLNDAPLVKTLLFLLVENLFHGDHWGPKDKDNAELWQTLLTDAAQQNLR